PASVAYQIRSFARRHKALVTGAAVVLVVLLGGVVTTSWQAIRATHERNRADQEAQIAQAVNDFFNKDLLGAVAPSVESGKGVDVKRPAGREEAPKRIAAASGRGGRLGEKPLVEAAIRDMIGWTFNELGLGARAEPHLKRAAELRRQHQSADHPETAKSMLR